MRILGIGLGVLATAALVNNNRLVLVHLGVGEASPVVLASLTT